MATKSKSGASKTKSSSKTTHKKTAKSGTSKSKTTAKNSKSKKSSGSGNRCWAGYEPTPGKKPGSKGSCKPKSS